MCSHFSTIGVNGSSAVGTPHRSAAAEIARFPTGVVAARRGHQPCLKREDGLLELVDAPLRRWPGPLPLLFLGSVIERVGCLAVVLVDREFPVTQDTVETKAQDGAGTGLRTF